MDSALSTVPVKLSLGTKYEHVNKIPPRYQWEANGGYCGEVSMISAGLFYGQYLSQYDVRAIVSGGGQGTNSQLLLGDNASAAATALRLKCEVCPHSEDSKKLLLWIKNQVVKSHPVIIGVFNNENQMYGHASGGTEGDPQYDHIVPVMGFASNHPFSDHKLYPDDKILFSDNGLYTKNGKNPCPPINSETPYYYHYPMNGGDKSYNFVLSRSQANDAGGNLYSLLDLPKYKDTPPLPNSPPHKKKNYAIAITGVIDRNNETLPVTVRTNHNYECPHIVDGTSVRPLPMALTLKVTISGLTPNTEYKLYRYNDETKVPTENFNQNKHMAESVTNIKISQGTVYEETINITSNQKVFFRAVNNG